jgi:hypothetical protein
MKNVLLLSALILLNIPLVFSQRSDGEMQTLSGHLNHSGGYGALIFKSSDFKDSPLILGGARGSWVINRSFGIGFEGCGIIPTSTYEGIDPLGLKEAYLIGGYGGLSLEPVIWSNRVIHLVFPVQMGGGWLGYVEEWDYDPDYNYDEGELYDDDVFWFIEPGGSLELNVASFFRINVGITYRFTEDLDLIETSPNEFDNLNFSLALKFGCF